MCHPHNGSDSQISRTKLLQEIRNFLDFLKRRRLFRLAYLLNFRMMFERKRALTLKNLFFYFLFSLSNSLTEERIQRGVR